MTSLNVSDEFLGILHTTTFLGKQKTMIQKYNNWISSEFLVNCRATTEGYHRSRYFLRSTFILSFCRAMGREIENEILGVLETYVHVVRTSHLSKNLPNQADYIVRREFVSSRK